MRLNKLLIAVRNGKLWEISNKLLQKIYGVEVIRGDVFHTSIIKYYKDSAIKNLEWLESTITDEIVDAYIDERFTRLNDTQYNVIVEGEDRSGDYRMFLFRSVENETDKTEYTDVTDI